MPHFSVIITNLNISQGPHLLKVKGPAKIQVKCYEKASQIIFLNYDINLLSLGNQCKLQVYYQGITGLFENHSYMENNHTNFQIILQYNLIRQPTLKYNFFLITTITSIIGVILVIIIFLLFIWIILLKKYKTLVIDEQSWEQTSHCHDLISNNQNEKLHNDICSPKPVNKNPSNSAKTINN